MRLGFSPRSMSASRAGLPLRTRALLTAGAIFAFVIGLGGAAAEAKMLGIIYPESCGFYDAGTEAFKTYLGGNGFGPDKLEIFVQKPAADPMSWTNALRKFAAVDADLIVVWGDALLQTACREKIKTPILFGYALEPGLNPCARSASNPSGSAAGVTAHTPLQTLLAKARLMTDFKTVGVLTLPDDKVSLAMVDELKPLGSEFGFTVTILPVAKRDEAAAVFKDAPAPGLFLLPGCPLVAGQMEELLGIAAQKKIPTISLLPPRTGSAPLLSLYANPEEEGRLLGEQAVQILKGGKPTVPVLTPKRIELEINLPLAKQLGVKVPMALLESATRIIK